MKNKIIIVFVNLIITFSYCQTSIYNTAFYSGFLINNNLTLNMTEQELINSLGQPDNIENLTDDPTQYKVYKYLSKNSYFTFNTTDNYLSNMSIKSELIPVMYQGNNLSINQTTNNLETLFPNSFMLSNGTDKQIYLNLKSDNNEFWELFIYFTWNNFIDTNNNTIKKVSEFYYSEFD